MEQHLTCERVYLERTHARGVLYRAQRVLEQAEHRCRSAFNELHLLEASLETLHERRAHANAQTFDLDLVVMGVTEEETEARAARLIKLRHAEEIRELDEQIATLSCS